MNYGNGYRPKRQKYGNKKVTTEDGLTFDSKKEFNRHRQLCLLESQGKISNLQRQVKYVLIPSQYIAVIDAKGKPVRRCVERPVTYIADFVYTDADGQTVVEDTKGFRTDAYILKRKMMLHFYGIRIHEI